MPKQTYFMLYGIPAKWSQTLIVPLADNFQLCCIHINILEAKISQPHIKQLKLFTQVLILKVILVRILFRNKTRIHNKLGGTKCKNKLGLSCAKLSSAYASC